MSFLYLLLLSRPANKEELFNLRHASARNVIERIFGVIKRCFRILLLPPEYSIDIQAYIPVALCVIHNIIKSHSDPDPEDIGSDHIAQDWTVSVERGDGVPEHTGDGEIGFEDGGEADAGPRADAGPCADADADAGPYAEEICLVDTKILRNSIAEAMWKDYQEYLLA